MIDKGSCLPFVGDAEGEEADAPFELPLLLLSDEEPAVEDWEEEDADELAELLPSLELSLDEEDSGSDSWY